MKTTYIRVSGEVSLTYDENSQEFKNALESYRDVIERNGTKESMLKYVAFYVTRFGTDGMIEGVGYVGYNNRLPKNMSLYSGITVDDGYDEFDFEI